MISKPFLDAVKRCYGLDEVRAVRKVYQGTNRVYKLLCSSGPTVTKAALKLGRVSGEHGQLHKAAQNKLLLSLSDRFPFIPRIVPPHGERNNGYKDCAVHPWGIIYDGTWSAALYEWLDCKPFRPSARHLAGAGKRAGQLQRCLERLGFHDDCLEDRSASTLISFSRMGYRMNRLFSFTEFTGFLEDDGESEAAAYAYAHLPFLEEELESAREGLDKNKGPLLAQAPGLIHAELSPSNFGFDAAGEVSMIFDFDSIRYGPRSQDSAWMLSSFCIRHRETPAQVRRKIKTLLRALDSASPLRSEEVALIDLFIRVNYLEAIHRKLANRHSGRDPRMGFLKEDILALQWLRANQFRLGDIHAQTASPGATV